MPFQSNFTGNIEENSHPKQLINKQDESQSFAVNNIHMYETALNFNPQTNGCQASNDQVAGHQNVRLSTNVAHHIVHHHFILPFNAAKTSNTRKDRHTKAKQVKKSGMGSNNHNVSQISRPMNAGKSRYARKRLRRRMEMVQQQQ